MKDPASETIAVPEIPAQAKVVCPNCRMENVLQNVEPQMEFTCHFCRTPVSIRTFPRLKSGKKHDEKNNHATDGDATCLFFPELKAEVVCAECGSFLSQKAAVDWNGTSMCLPCMHRLRETKSDIEYRPELKIWDNRALGLLALLPFTLFTAPAALFLLLKFRNEPKSWIPRSKLRWWLALTLTILILLAWTALIVIWIAMLTRELS